MYNTNYPHIIGQKPKRLTKPVAFHSWPVPFPAQDGQLSIPDNAPQPQNTEELTDDKVIRINLRK